MGCVERENGSPKAVTRAVWPLAALGFVAALAPSVARAADVGDGVAANADAVTRDAVTRDAVTRDAVATDGDGHASRSRSPLADAPPVSSEEREPFRIKPGYAHLFATALVGSGLRFNNPYRLATPLGRDAESVSRSASYVDVGGAVTFGHPFGLQHGVALRTAVAIEGIGQIVLSSSYVVWRRWTQLALFGRAGVPLVLTPDATMGLEGSAGAAWFFLGGIGATAELVGNLFYGTGTADVATTTYPMVSLQAGLIVSYEVLP